jgi:hypothetical protein
MTSSNITSCKKAISVIKEDYVPTQKSRILCFHPDGSVKRLNAHQSATSERCGNTVRTPISFEKLRIVQGCIRRNVMATRPDALRLRG